MDLCDCRHLRFGLSVPILSRSSELVDLERTLYLVDCHPLFVVLGPSALMDCAMSMAWVQLTYLARKYCPMVQRCLW